MVGKDVLEKTDIPVEIWDEVLERILAMENVFYYKDFLKGKSKGTVWSGHATRTTLFNTTRVLLY